jgi:putative colanic acid biosynthesis glycosyltransferase
VVPIRVLQINSVCGIGSTGRIATDIHQVLKEQGHESYIAFGRDEPKNCDSVIRIGSNWDVYRHVALTRVFDKHGFGSKRATRAFLREVDKLNPDIIHLHNIHGYYLNVELLFDYLKVADKLVIWTLHDCWAFTGHCSHFDYIGCTKWRTGCFDCPQKEEYPKSVLFDNSRDNFFRKKTAFTGVKNLTIVTPSQWLAGLVGDSFLGDYPVKVINNGIDLSVFKPTPSDFRQRYSLENKFIILGVANVWTEKKGFYYFIELSGHLMPDEVIVLVGLTEKQKATLPSGIIGIKRTNSVEELAEIYSDADVFINLTLEDNFPTTNLEALACGTPVITFDTGGSAESIDKTYGFIARQGSLDDTLNFIRIVKKNRKKVYEENCLNRARRLYDKKDRFADYISMYERIQNIDE